MRSLGGLVALVLLACVVHANAQCPNPPTKKWSVEYASLAAGADVQVTERIFLDVSTPVLGIVNILAGGAIVFDPSTTETVLRLRAHSIIVNAGGSLLAGCEEAPFEKRADIVMHGKRSDYTAEQIQMHPGVKNIVVHGTLKIFAAMPGLTWTILAKTAPYDINTKMGVDKVELVEEVPGWRVGDYIVFASTDYDLEQTEKRRITSISGTTLTLDKPLKYMHWGEIWTAPNGDYVDERGEVALLTRRFHFYGDTDDGESGNEAVRFGAHIFIYGGVVQIEGVEFFHVGQAGVLARYPVHFHVANKMDTSFVKKCTFRDTFQRCITIHYTHGVLLQENVAYNALGHCYFFEDGIEMGNTAIRNIGMYVLPPYMNYTAKPPIDHRLLEVDREPAIFWITHPPNHFYGNVAAGGTWGYWFSFPEHPIGVGATQYARPADNKYFWPTFFPMGEFKHNKAHSLSEDGIFIDRGITENPTCDGETIETCGDAPGSTSYVPRDFLYDDIPADLTLTKAQMEALIRARPMKPAIIEDFTGYKIRQIGIWGRGAGIWVIRPRLANNQVGAQFPGNGHYLFNGVIVGDTNNVGTPSRPMEEQGRSRPLLYRPEYPIIGYRNYDSGGPDAIFDTHFHNFQNDTFRYTYKVRVAGALGAQNGPFVLPSRSVYLRTSFYNTTDSNIFSFVGDARSDSADPAIGQRAIVDADGSVTGHLKGGGCGAYIVADVDHLLTPDCRLMPGWNAQLCRAEGVSPARRFFRVEYRNGQIPPIVVEPYPCCTNKTRALLYRLDQKEGSIRLDPHKGDVYRITPEAPQTVPVELEYMAHVVVNSEYMVHFGDEGITPAQFTVSLGHSIVGNSYSPADWSPEWLRVAVPYPKNSVLNVTIGSGNSEAPFKKVSSKAELTRETFFWDNEKGLLWVHLQAAVDAFFYYPGHPQAFSGTNAYAQIYATCPGGSCAVPNPVIPRGQSPPPQRPFSRDCQAGGGFTRGTHTFTPVGSVEHIFKDGFRPGWGMASWTPNWGLVSSLAPAQRPEGVIGDALYSDWANYQGIYMYDQTRQKTENFTLTDQTHFSFMARAGYRSGELHFYVRFNNNRGLYYTNLYTNNPWFLGNQPPPDESGWRQIVIPLADLGLKSGDVIGAFNFFNNHPRAVRAFYDEMYFAKFDVKLEPTQWQNPGEVRAAAPTSSSSHAYPLAACAVAAIVALLL